MALPPPTPPAAGWFPDPWVAGYLRYWDGGAWTPWVHVVAPQPAPRPELPLRAGLIGLAMVLLGFLASIVVALPLYLVGAPDVVLLAASVAGLYGTLLLYCRHVSRRYGTGRFGPDFGFQLRWIDLALGLGTWFAAVVAQVVVLMVVTLLGLPLGSNTDSLTDSRESTLTFLAIAVVAVLVAPVVEELFFRGLLLRSLESRLVPWLAIVTQGLLFGLIHLQPDLGSANASLVLALASVGCVFGVAADRVGRLGPAIVGHAVFNGVAVVVAWAVS